MLRALPPALPDHTANHHGHVHGSTIHIVRLGGHVDQLVHAQHNEIHTDMDMDRAQAGHSGADGYASHGVFGKRRVKDSPGPEPLLQAASGSLNGLMVINIET